MCGLLLHAIVIKVKEIFVLLALLRLNLAMESKLPIGPVRSRTWHPITSEKLITPTVKRPATTLGITHPPVITSTVIQRPLTRPKTTTGNKNWSVSSVFNYSFTDKIYHKIMYCRYEHTWTAIANCLILEFFLCHLLLDFVSFFCHKYDLYK